MSCSIMPICVDEKHDALCCLALLSPDVCHHDLWGVSMTTGMTGIIMTDDIELQCGCQGDEPRHLMRDNPSPTDHGDVDGGPNVLGRLNMPSSSLVIIIRLKSKICPALLKSDRSHLKHIELSVLREGKVIRP